MLRQYRNHLGTLSDCNGGNPLANQSLFLDRTNHIGVWSTSVSNKTDKNPEMGVLKFRRPTTTVYSKQNR
jgi:hypothetical protein